MELVPSTVRSICTTVLPSGTQELTVVEALERMIAHGSVNCSFPMKVMTKTRRE